MTNITIKANGSSIIAEANGKLTSGMVGVPVVIEYNEEWNGLIKTAIFRVGQFSRDRRNIETSTTVPWEVMRHGGKILEVGIEGRNADGDIIMPTVWATVARIFNGANATIMGAPTPDNEACVGGGAEVLNVWVEGDEADHTSSEIYDHVANVRGPVQLHCDDGYYQLLHVADGSVAYFGYIADEQLINVVVIDGNRVERYEHLFASLDNINEAIGVLVKTVNGIAPDENGNVEIGDGGGGNDIFYVDVSETGDSSILNTEWSNIIEAYDNNNVLICRYFKMVGGVSYNTLAGMYRYIGNGNGQFIFSGTTSDGDIQVIKIIRPQNDIQASVSYTKVETTRLGDISTALDHIVALQEELIGL